ncbi:MAG: protein kinase [Defluviitaleaceae bacterium]|nr:protein kinase [Defluviitaleaceae bacterium]
MNDPWNGFAFTETILPEEIAARFDTVERVGKGEFGETFILSEKETQTLYIIKTSQEREADNEAALLAGLNHKGLPQNEAVIEQNGTRYTLRKYIHGSPLNDYLAEAENPSPAQAVNLFLSLCDILIYLHAQPEPIIHRDIKPSNIIIDPETLAPTLIDFGISRRYSTSAETDTTYLGTHKYAPPEQYGFAQTDARTDIYALGAVMQYVLTKMKDNRLERIAAKCTELAPAMRYQSAAALKRALLKYKNRVRRRVCNLAACAVFTFAVLLGIYALTAREIPAEMPAPIIYITPYGYDDNDYQKLVAFFLYEDNLAKIQAQNPAFDIKNPETWSNWPRGGTWTDDDGVEHLLTNYIHWIFERVYYLCLYNLNLTGELDVSGFDRLRLLELPRNNLTGVNLSGCISLYDLRLSDNRLTQLDVSHNIMLEQLHVAFNQIAELDLTTNTVLRYLDCAYNYLTRLDLSGLTLLEHVEYSGNPLREVLR